MDKIKNHLTLSNLIQFVKLQLAGNILFWGTLIGSFVFHEMLHWTEFIALVSASIISHILFFIADKEWVFNEGKDRRKTTDEIWRFVVFMGLNFFINLGIVTGVDSLLDAHPISLAELGRESGRVRVYG
jgi:putative flippase GtrA